MSGIDSIQPRIPEGDCTAYAEFMDRIRSGQECRTTIARAIDAYPMSGFTKTALGQELALKIRDRVFWFKNVYPIWRFCRAEEILAKYLNSNLFLDQEDKKAVRLWWDEIRKSGIDS